MSARRQSHEHTENLYLDHACQCCIDALEIEGFSISTEDANIIRNDLRDILRCTINIRIRSSDR